MWRGEGGRGLLSVGEVNTNQRLSGGKAVRVFNMMEVRAFLSITAGLGNERLLIGWTTTAIVLAANAKRVPI